MNHSHRTPPILTHGLTFVSLAVGQVVDPGTLYADNEVVTQNVRLTSVVCSQVPFHLLCL